MLCLLVMAVLGGFVLWVWKVVGDNGAAGWLFLIFLATAVVCAPLAILFWGMGLRASARKWRF